MFAVKHVLSGRSLGLALLPTVFAVTPALARPQGPFQVVTTSLPPGSANEINRPIDIQFNAAVDLTTVNSASLHLVDRDTGAPAVGEFSLAAADTVRFQPRCPARLDLSDAGLLPGRVWHLELPAENGAAPVVRSTTGVGLATVFAVDFASAQPSSAFVDTRSGPPAPVLRVGGSRLATRLQLASDPNQRVYFEPRAVPDLTLGADVPAGFLAPLNLRSTARSRVTAILVLDQMIATDPANLAEDRVRLEWESAPGAWSAFPRTVRVTANCTNVGGVLEVQPEGVLPQDRRVRLVLGAGFRDVVGEALASDLVVGAFSVGAALDPGTSTLGDGADEAFEGFDSVVLEDALYAPPAGATRAVWGADGKLLHAGFEGTGGPNGTFDWVVDGTVILNTAFSVITDVTQTSTQTVVGGLVDVRSLWVTPTGVLIIEGPNPCTIRASGAIPTTLPGYPVGTPQTGVLVQGLVRCNGRGNNGVVSFNTTNIPELGAQGMCGGGDGGTGSSLTTESTPIGGNGFGPFGGARGGGGGGESGYNNSGVSTARRPGGGGGGRLGADQHELSRPNCPDQRIIGLDAEVGKNGAITAFGALHPGITPPLGGSIGASPFVNADPNDDFWGTMITASGAVVRGELAGPIAGSGGGGGGDACGTSSFPTTPFTPVGDEKGAGGGGGGGSVTVLAAGDIRIGGIGNAARGRIELNGGCGGGGENTNGIDRIGGGSGGGSGGHLVLQSASQIDLSRCTSVSTTVNGQSFWGGLFARGGQGGEGANGLGGARPNAIETVPQIDSLPGNSYPSTSGSSAPCSVFTGANDAASTVGGYVNPPQFRFTNNTGVVTGCGGDGGPGIIQLHAPRVTDIVLPATVPPVSFRDVCVPLPVGGTPSNANSPAQWDHLLPSFALHSAARSKWIALGAPEVAPGSPTPDLVSFAFGGVDPLDGRVLTSGASVPFDVAELPPAIAGQLAPAPTLPYVAADGRSLLVDGALVDDVYRRAPQLAKRFLLRLGGQEFTVGAASFAPSTGILRLTVEESGTPLAGFGTGAAFELVPRFFRAGSGPGFDELWSTQSIHVRFQAARADAFGRPDELSASALSADVAQLSTPGASWRFVRFVVEFDAGPLGSPGSAPGTAPFVDFLRLPFRF
ncbi:MAG: hypothetical protein U1F29_08150 [Planctomycetota bacterium]